MSGRPCNLCRSCGLDFASIRAFDRHRVGTHAYTFAEGLAQGLKDGRRCLDPNEMLASGMAPNARGRWTILAEADSARARFAERRSTA